MTTSTGDPLFEFVGTNVRSLDGGLLVATTHADASVSFWETTVNLHYVELPSGRTQFIATVAGDYWMAGDDRFIVWSELLCTTPWAGSTHLLDRNEGTLRRISIPIAGIFEDDGSISGTARIGETWNSDSVSWVEFDPETLAQRAVFRGHISRMRSDDRRYYAPYIRQAGGGPCAP